MTEIKISDRDREIARKALCAWCDGACVCASPSCNWQSSPASARNVAENHRHDQRWLEQRVAMAVAEVRAESEAELAQLRAFLDEAREASSAVHAALCSDDHTHLGNDSLAAEGRCSAEMARKLRADLAAANRRCRRASQVLIDEIGADGPEDVDSTALRAAEIINTESAALVRLRAILAETTVRVEELQAHHEHEHESLAAILGTGDSLAELARRLVARVAELEARKPVVCERCAATGWENRHWEDHGWYPGRRMITNRDGSKTPCEPDDGNRTCPDCLGAGAVWVQS